MTSTQRARGEIFKLSLVDRDGCSESPAGIAHGDISRAAFLIWLPVTAWASGPARAGGSCGNCHRRMFCDSSVAFLRLQRAAVATAVL